MREFAQRMLNLDRRVIFLLVALVTLLSLLFPVGLPVRVSSEVKRVYDYIESLPEGSVFLLSLDFDPASKPELYPMSMALLRHAFRRNLRVIGLTLWVTGTGMAESVFVQTAQEAGKERDRDYVFLGYSPGGPNVIISMGQDLYAAFPTDYYGTPITQLSMLKTIHTLRDVDYVVSLSAGASEGLAAGLSDIEAWYIYGKEKYQFELGGGCTAVSAPGLYPLLDTGQINGLLGGLRGAAEYETLIGVTGKAIAGMDAQSATHFLIIFLIFLCNLFYFLSGGGTARS